jgi:hypothetical protein
MYMLVVLPCFLCASIVLILMPNTQSMTCFDVLALPNGLYDMEVPTEVYTF